MMFRVYHLRYSVNAVLAFCAVSQTELQSFAERAEQVRAVVEPGFKSAFRVCNLQPSLDLLEELKKTPSPHTPLPKSTQSHAGEMLYREAIIWQ